MNGVRGMAALAALLALLAASACGYHLAGRGGAGSFLPDDVHSIAIPTFENRTERPELEQRVTEALTDEFVRRGRLESRADPRDADVLLEGKITAFRTDPVTFTAGGRFDRVEVTLTAEVRLVRTSPEAVLWTQNHFVFREQYNVPETPLAEFDREIVAVEEIADGFARSVVTSILEGF